MKIQLQNHLQRITMMQKQEKALNQKSARDYQHYLDECLFTSSSKDISSQQDSIFVEKELHLQFPQEKPSAKFKKVQSAETMIEGSLSDHEVEWQSKNSDGIVRVGYLSRRTDSIIRSWEKVYCILSKSKFRCYEDKTRTVLVSCLNFKKVKSEVESAKDMPNCFDLRWDDEVVATFKADSPTDLHFWVEDIEQRIKAYSNQKKLKIRKASRIIYRDQDTLTEEEFFDVAGTGDILLMKTADSSCALQRLVTNSDYDHVSMVVKFSQNDIKIFESNADEGVKLYDWEEFQCKFNHFEKITMRKLHHHLGEELHKHILKFIKKTIGRLYSCNAIKILRKNSSEQGEEYQSEYFCSELIAKAYKYLKILDRSKGSNSYWPVDFTVRGAMTLEGSYLGMERVILLKKHLRNAQ